MAKYEYDAVVIGGGAAGLTAAGMAANFGAKTMMVEKERLGGDCTWTGCVPSKVLLKAGKVAQQMRKADKYGLFKHEPEIDFQKVMNHVQDKRKEIYNEADRPEIFEEMGIEVVKGTARFSDDHHIAIKASDGGVQRISSRYFFICAGASAVVPPITGVENTPYLTNETLFEIEELADRLTIIGAGPVGTEMAQAMNRLGASVTVVDMADRILGHDDPELTAMLKDHLEEEGIAYELGAEVKSVSSNSGIITTIETDGMSKRIKSGQLLIAAGRQANVQGLGLEEAGISYSPSGITIDEKCRTNKSHIFACGDITGRYQFTHMSEHMSKVAVTNALLKFPMKTDEDHLPWVTYTDPELGHVGATASQLEERGIHYQTYRFPYSKIDRALAESREKGLIKIHAKKWNGKIYGVSIWGARAGELISEYALAMKNGISLRNIADTIHPYPSYGLGARRAADQWYIKNQSEWQVKLLKKVFGYRGEGPDLSDPDRIV